MSLISEIKKIISEQRKEKACHRRNENRLDFFPMSDHHESEICDTRIRTLEAVLKLIK